MPRGTILIFLSGALTTFSLLTGLTARDQEIRYRVFISLACLVLSIAFLVVGLRRWRADG